MNRDEKQREFTRLFSQCERQLFAYIWSLVPSDQDARDVLQETAAALWEKLEEYDAEKPFTTWARKFAHIQVLKHRETQARGYTNLIRFADETISALSAEFEEHRDVIDLRQEALTGCLQRLSDNDVELLRSRYWTQDNLRQQAKASELNEDQMYRRLNKIRKQLRDCINAAIARGEV
jgi:RNA polymerase sigma-70 factor (ECF subfamily)